MDFPSENFLKEDKAVKFDTPNLQKNLIRGEVVLDTIPQIEDSKGNPGDFGRLLATNLRLIWHSLTHKKHNLSIGYGSIAVINKRSAFDKVHNTMQMLYVLAVYNNSRFEFLFTDVSSGMGHRNDNIFVNVIELHRLYQRTYLYRDLKLRGAILSKGQLILLPKEQVYSTVQGVMNLSSDQGNLGAFVVTNIRLVWYADANDNFNISLSFLQIASIRTRGSKYGPALVIETSEYSGGFTLGFRIDPPERLHNINKELVSLHSIYMQQPIFGVDHNYLLSKQEQHKIQLEKEKNDFHTSEFVEIDDKQEREINSKINNYLAKSGFIAPNEQSTTKVVYCKELGFAMESLPPGYILKDLWDVLPSQNNL